jgi:hypothetical protein|tara:strand:- start:6792 stop:8510 length:1719 start_codon:yes stop_codon:yes gene_type:complete
MTRAVVAFGRMNPPTVGHEKLAKKISDEARKRKAMPHIYLSHSQDKKKNPLNYNDKIKYVRKAFGKMVTKSSARSIIEVFKELEKMGHTEVVVVAGSDRVNEFNSLLQKYNGKEYNFEKIEVISAGERDPDSEGVDGMSGTKLRDLAKSGDFDTFKTGLASKLGDTDKMKVYNIIRSVNEASDEDEDEEGDDAYDDMLDFPDAELMKALDDIYPGIRDADDDDEEEDDVEEDRAPLTLQQRMKRKMLMKKLAPKMARKRALAMKRKAGPQQLELRARKAAIMILRKKVAGPKGAKYATLSPSEKIGIDKRVAKKMGMVGKIARKLLPVIRKKEIARFASLNKNEEFTNYLDEGEKKGLWYNINKKRKEGRPMRKPGSKGAPTDQDFKNAQEKFELDEEFTNYMFEKFIRLEEKSTVDLEIKAEKSGISYSIIREVYRRGMESYESSKQTDTTPQQWAYARVNSYIAGGKTGDADLNEASSVPNIKKGDWITVSKAKRPFTAAGIQDPKRMEPASSEKMYVHKITKSKVHLRYDPKNMKGYAINLDKMPDFLSVKLAESLDEEFLALFKENQD